MSKELSLETLKDAIRNETCKVYDRSDFGGSQEGFFVEIDTENGGSLHVSKTGRVVIDYQLEDVEMKRLSVLALRQSVDRLDADRAKTARALQQAEAELVKILKGRGEL